MKILIIFIILNQKNKVKEVHQQKETQWYTSLILGQMRKIKFKIKQIKINIETQ
jgi:hypothetical protein